MPPTDTDINPGQHNKTHGQFADRTLIAKYDQRTDLAHH